MSVAESFRKYPIVGEPYEKNDKQYVKIKYADGHLREVRWYDDETVKTSLGKKIRPRKEVLGFFDDYITIFRGPTDSFAEWFIEHGARYNVFFGWHFFSNMEVPTVLPTELTAVKLYWEEVADVVADELKPEKEMRAAVDKHLYTPSASTHVGKIGDRIELTLLVLKAIEMPDSYYGKSMFYVMSDENDNQFTWTTSSKILIEGENYHLRGSIKNHIVYKGIPQTVLTRCTII